MMTPGDGRDRPSGTEHSAEKDRDCVFCQIVAGEAPARIAARTEGVVAFHPLNPVTEGHLLVVPTEHVLDFMHKPQVTGMVASFAARIASDWMGGGDSNLITSAGGYATQTVRHLHLHIVPRSRDDGLALPWTGPVTPPGETGSGDRPGGA